MLNLLQHKAHVRSFPWFRIPAIIANIPYASQPPVPAIAFNWKFGKLSANDSEYDLRFELQSMVRHVSAKKLL